MRHIHWKHCNTNGAHVIEFSTKFYKNTEETVTDSEIIVLGCKGANRSFKGEEVAEIWCRIYLGSGSNKSS